MLKYSISPDKIRYKIPKEIDKINEILKIKNRCKIERNKGKKIVLIQGLGFVGAIMAAIVADCEINDKIPYFVIGIDLPSKNSYWKIAKINSGKSPYNIADSEINIIFQRTIFKKRNLLATYVMDAYEEADIIIVDINLDVLKLENGNAKNSKVIIEPFKKAIIDIGKRINPESLLLIETTIPPGTIEKIVKPSIIKCFKERGIDDKNYPPLIANSYERVMPGKEYIDSIKKMHRTISATNQKAMRKVKDFLSSIIDTKNYPISELKSTTASELGKILENAYRAVNIAFIYEWTLFAEDIGVNLFEVINSIKVRKGTHDNIMYPGFGVGGYCLPKDPILADWASEFLYKRKQYLKFSIEAVNINDLMPHHTFELLLKALGNKNILNKKITILGASYRKDVDDTRNSPSIILYDDIVRFGGIPFIHDPYAKSILGREDIEIQDNIEIALENASAVIFVVNHNQYEILSMNYLISYINNNACVIDAFNMLSDEKITFLKSKNFKVLGVGKGHIKYL